MSLVRILDDLARIAYRCRLSGDNEHRLVRKMGALEVETASCRCSAFAVVFDGARVWPGAGSESRPRSQWERILRRATGSGFRQTPRADRGDVGQLANQWRAAETRLELWRGPA